MTELLDGRTAIVTGAGRGIGEAIARALAENGAAVVLSARTLQQVSLVAHSINAGGGTAIALACDVTSEESVAALTGEVMSQFGSADILVNNAGAGHSALLHRTTLEAWNRLFAVNVTGSFLCTRAFLPGMLAQEWGRVINIASVAGLTGQRYIAAYTASKHAVIGLTRAGAAETGGTGVTINALCPAFVDTPMTDETVANVAKQTGRPTAEALAMVLATTGQARLVTADEVARGVIALCDADAAATNGAAIVIDGKDPA